MEDREIVALYMARDERAIEVSADRYGRYVMGISMQILQSMADAEECVNDTWLKAWNTIPPQDPPSLKMYLGRLVRCLSIDRWRMLRRGKRNRDLEVALDELTGCAPAEEVGESALTDALNAFLDGLEPLDRKLFMGRYWHVYSVKRLAAAYGLTEGNVSVRLHRLRERLREHLLERGIKV